MTTVTSVYLGELRVESEHLASSVKMITDAPIDNNGKGASFSPTDCVATSLATCMLTVMGIAARNRNIDITGSKASVTKVMASNPRRITKIGVVSTMRSDGSKDDNQQLERVGTACPVAKSLHPDIEQDILFKWEH